MKEAEIQAVAAADGAMSMTIPNRSTTLGYKVLINGLAQGKSEYSFISNSLNLPSTLNIIQGDTITFQYLHP